VAKGYINQLPACWLGLRWGTFTCVGWQVTLCDPIWQVTPEVYIYTASMEDAMQFSDSGCLFDKLQQTEEGKISITRRI